MFDRLRFRSQRAVLVAVGSALLVLNGFGILLWPSVTASASEPTEGDSSLQVATSVIEATWYLLGVAHLGGSGGSVWRSTGEVCNFGSSMANFDVQFLVADQGNPSPQTISDAIPGGECIRYYDVLNALFGVTSNKGSLRVVSQSSSLLVAGRTYNDRGAAGTFGQFDIGRMGSFTTGQMATLIHLSQSMNSSQGFRTNISLQNTTSFQITIEIELYRANGAYLGKVTETVNRYEYTLIAEIFKRVTSSNVDEGYAILYTMNGGGSFMTTASLVDNLTGDAATVPGQLLP